MASGKSPASDFTRVWSKALSEFYGHTDINLEDPSIAHPQSAEELIDYLHTEHEEFGHDTKSSKFTEVMKGAIGPFRFLTSTVGSTAATMFPGGSQVLAAVGVLVNAAQGVTKSFDAVGGLFGRIEAFTHRMSEVSHERLPENLIPIYQAMLVSLLKVCALATRLSFKSLEGVKPGEPKFFRKLKKMARPAVSKVAEYLRQLALGGNAEIDSAIGELQSLVENESLMMQAVTLRKSTRIESVVVDIKGLNIRLDKAIYELQADSGEIRFRITIMQQSLDRIEATSGTAATAAVSTKEIITEMKLTTTAIKAAQSKQATKSDMEAMTAKIDKLLEKAGGSTTQQSASAPTKASVSREAKQRSKLELDLGVKAARMASTAIFDRMNDDPGRMDGTVKRVMQERSFQQWLDGEIPVLLVSADSGYGKTYLASGLIDELLAKCKQGTESTHKSVAYFFCDKSQADLRSVNTALRVLAYGVAQNDKVYAKYLADLLEKGKLRATGDGSYGVAEENPPTTNADEPDTSTGSDPPTEALPDIVLADSLLKAVPESEQSQPTQEFTTDGASDEQPNTQEEGPGEQPALRIPERLDQMVRSLADGTPLEEEYEDSILRSTAAVWKILFPSYFDDESGTAYLFIDAIEECLEAHMLALIAAIRTSAPSNTPASPSKVQVMFFLSSDTARHIVPVLGSSTTHIPLNVRHTESDLDHWVVRRLQSAWKGKLVREQLSQEVKEKIVEHCKGNFLMATLLSEEICSLSREDVIRRTLASLPVDLTAAMLLIIDRLSRQLSVEDSEDLRDILAWIACSHRELNLAELDALLTMRRPSGAALIDLEDRLRRALVSLFTVSGENTAADQSAEDRFRKRCQVDTRNSASDYEKKGAHGRESEVVLSDIPPAEVKLKQTLLRMAQCWVQISHNRLAEKIQERQIQAGIIGFSTQSMQAMTLLGCLKALCNTAGLKDRETVARACGYAGAYLPEHLNDVAVEDVDGPMKAQIGLCLVRLLRDDACIDRWVGAAASFQTSDYLRSSEARGRILLWLQDPDVQEALIPEDKEWTAAVLRSPIPVMFERGSSWPRTVVVNGY
ncbi:hypothetical protein BAUCODRAFT_127159 [Baudoinia panamericana UAMH 10762]|uniref:Uncharacterized protein n=1 Tax=Baudoinia panamericana (strain UAMH 10762) TaxID=717646 RepID=M2M3U2_BAUPA|nr:uncharacterized protein BAUCODRAFT_127159 [Baudoinia panamericana UAMH 10762]EMC91241.1 hypothetical protein BAUCODRAFT_127159 [Baudoinia panamericana UAMH 10762]